MNWGRLMKRLHRARGMPLDVDGSKRQEQLVRLVLEHPDVAVRSEEHTSELQSPCNLVCRLLLEKKKHLNRAAKEGRGRVARAGCWEETRPQLHGVAVSRPVYYSCTSRRGSQSLMS